MPASDALSFKRQVVDQFFFTIIYAVLLYMMAVASFKLIDLVPKGILRWIGSGARTFQDIREDPTAGLTQYAAMGGYTIGQQVADTARQGFGLAGGIVDKLSGPGAERSLQAARSGEVSPSSATPGGMAGATAGGPTAPAGTPPATPTAAPPAPAPAPAPPAPPPAPAPRAAPPAPPAPPTGRGPTGGGGRGGSGGGSGRGSP